ncbi:acyl-CoA dehydrogenase family protein [Vitreoscilla stercoraria]|uniref:Acyl-CoA/acyl-ACP dehydrogenase n=1 Tax=Vitreoscilla stercoraria TaxID=61 RepID=A0ABY4EA53_VITST|nr:acyl-CoA dehydrogenase family protein [Vitreoscilla stercoraria]UOO91815.1 acyl-CoA/acyl-ACP dehydrogenase [Vitreoscilla stercoraria]
MTRESLMQAVSLHAQTQLRPLVEKIDREGFYPADYLRGVGELGGFAALGTVAEGGLGLGLAAQIEVIRRIGHECGSTAFMAWCQSACAWYLHQSQNAGVCERYLKDVLQANVLAGTGMSNTVKHLSGIEKHLLKAQKTDDGYVVSGMLPWVSNIGEGHVWAATAQVSETEFVMFMTGTHMDGVTLRDCPEFCGLEGTRTLGVKFKDVVITEADLLADTHQFADFIKAIKPGFILLQIGMGAGVVDGCIDIMRESNVVTAHVNQYLDDGEAETAAQLADNWAATVRLAEQADAGDVSMLEVCKTRLEASELSLAAAQSAALHAGAKGYLMRHPAQRRNREAMFVAIVTPAIKHLRKEIAKLECELVQAATAES